MRKRNPELVRGSLYRYELAQRLRGYRRYDKHPWNWVVRNSTIDGISKSFQIDVSKQITRIEKASNEKVRVLDLGCLQGEALSELARLHPKVECHGLTLARLEVWRKHKNIHWKTGHAENLRYPPKYFDFVYSYFGITHVQKIGIALKQLKRVLKDNGEAIINFQRDNLLNLVPVELKGTGTGDVFLDLYTLFERHGFKVLKTTYESFGKTYAFHIQKDAFHIQKFKRKRK